MSLKVKKNIKKLKTKVLFLGYNSSETKIINHLISNNCIVDHDNEKLNNFNINYDIVICFGYRHILKKEFINKCDCPIINLHISYLPYNRGAHPNFWSFYDNTICGVTIHLLDEGIDTGPILFQKKVIFKNEVTFYETYKRLFNEIENLFILNIKKILIQNWHEKLQKKRGFFSLSFRFT